MCTLVVEERTNGWIRLNFPLRRVVFIFNFKVKLLCEKVTSFIHNQILNSDLS